MITEKSSQKIYNFKFVLSDIQFLCHTQKLIANLSKHAGNKLVTLLDLLWLNLLFLIAVFIAFYMESTIYISYALYVKN